MSIITKFFRNILQITEFFRNILQITEFFRNILQITRFFVLISGIHLWLLEPIISHVYFE